MPYTTNRKIDRNALCKIADRKSARQKSRRVVAPSTEMQKRLAIIWQEVLGVENIGITDNFFSLGGHSIKASQLLNRIYESTAIGIKLTDVFRHPTIAELAEKLSAQEQEMFQFIDII
jgi:gramicidin S synthase 2/tyrocidine synthetase-3